MENTFEKIKDQVFNDLIKRKEQLGLLTTQKEKESEYSRLNQLVEGEIALKPNKHEGRTNILLVNDDMERTQIDLLIQYKQIDNCFMALDRHKELNNAIISNLETNVATLTDKMLTIKDTALELSDDVVHIENFRTSDSICQDESLYTDDAGHPIDYSYKVDYDDVVEAIKIPKLVSINKLIASNGQKMALIHINKQIGSGLINTKNPNNSIDKAIDTDMTTYWEETILADEPINVELDKIKYHQHNFGALCEVEITFNSMTEFNEIKLTPFGAYPIDVVAIKYYKTDQPDREEDEIIKQHGDLSSIEIVSPVKLDKLKSTIMEDSTLFQFPTVIAKRMRIVLAQRHYVKNSFIYDKNQYEKNELWFATSAKPEVTLKAHQQGLYNVKAFMEKQWVLFTNVLNKVKTLSEINIEEILFPKSTKLSPATKYEYNYGLYNIGINENNFKNIGVYISNPIKISGNIGAIDFIADEEYDPLEHDIFYYVSLIDNPTGKDWIRIYNNNSLNLISMLELGDMDYILEREKHFGTRGTQIQLAHTPYVQLHKPSTSYVNVTVITPDGRVLEEPTAVQNVTNYNNPAESYKRFSNNTDVIQYYFYGDKIYFNKAISSEHIIEINYKRFVDSARLKAVFKRKDGSKNGLTPILNGYKLVFKPIR